MRSLVIQQKGESDQIDIFTIPTQWFTVNGLEELTVERFEQEIKKQEGFRDAQSKMVSKTFDDILNREETKNPKA